MNLLNISQRKQWCCVKLPIIFVLALIAQLLEVFATPSAPDTIIVSASLLAKGIRLDSVRLRFHAGDEMQWKDPNFDDSAWQIVRNDTAGRLLPSGIGWFRVYLRVMPDAASTIASVWTEPLYAAQETYLDGKPLYAAGVPSAQAEQERVAYYGDPRISFPSVPLPLTSATVHLLALRLSTWERATARMWFAWRPVTTVWFDEGATFYIYEQSYIIGNWSGQLN